MKQLEQETPGGRLRTWRTYLKMTQTEFAENSGISLVMLKKYETNRASPGAQALTQVAESGASIDWLLTGKGRMLAEGLTFSQISPDRVRSWVFSREAFDAPDPHLIAVYGRLSELTFTSGRLTWLPDGLTVPQLRQLTKFATMLLWEVAMFSPKQMDRLLQDSAHIDAALLLGWRKKEVYTGTEQKDIASPGEGLQIIEAHLPLPALGKEPEGLHVDKKRTKRQVKPSL